jgi:hypothetical protein
MGAQENTDEKGPGVVGFSRALAGRSFFNVNHDFEEIPIYFSAEIGGDRRFNQFAKTHAVFNLGIIAGANEVLWKAYHFGPAHDILDKPENVAQYTTLLLRLKALYEKYKSEKRINVGDILEDLDNIVIELIDFSREIMKQSNCKRLQDH